MDTFKSNSEEIPFSNLIPSDDSSDEKLMSTHLSDHSFEDQFIEAFLKSQGNNKEFSLEKFFSKWFGNKDSAFFFLFKKNLKVTNIQFSELLALLRCYTNSRSSGKSIRNLQFLTMSEFENIIDGIIEAFFQTSDTSDYSKNSKNIKHVVDLYLPLLSRTIVVESFYGSCAVYVPPNLKIELISICAKSGYIDSCGSKVFIKNISQAKKKDFFKKIKNYFENHQKDPPSKNLVRFGIYSHEDFSIKPQDKDSSTDSDKNHKNNNSIEIDINTKEMERNGLDDVKIYAEKYYMGRDKLVNILKNMRTEFDKKLLILEPGDYSQNTSSYDIDQDRTLWLIVDKSIDKGSKFPGKYQYFICYEQLYSNKNSYHFFDENKPGWIAPITIPHTLIGAMINLTRPWWSDKNKIILGDPFVGTGTTLLEMLKFSNISINCSDKNDMVRLLVKDNLEFFSLSFDSLIDFQRNLNSTKDVLKRFLKDEFIKENSQSKFYNEINWVYNSRLKVGGITESDYQFESVIENLIEKGLFARILFYLSLKTKQRQITNKKLSEIDWAKAYIKDVNRLLCQLEGLIELRGKEQNGETKGTIKEFQGNYSKYCSICPDHLANIFKDIKMTKNPNGLANDVDQCRKINVNIKEVSKLEEQSYDIIVTDPPYGFNTDESPKALAEMYSDAIRNMIKALKPNGQLVICLLDSVRTGKQSPFFIHKEFVAQQILRIAEEEQREVINSMVKGFSPDEIFQGPYYWESERSLRRAILHFRIK